MKTTLKVVFAGFIAGFAGAFTFYHYYIQPALKAGDDRGCIQPGEV